MPNPGVRFPVVSTLGHPDLAAAVDVLCGAELAAVVELVAWLDGTDLWVANSAGAVRVAPDGSSAVTGRNPIGRQDPLAAATADAERADPHPPAERNDHPDAVRRLREAFADADRAPDLVVVHTDGHYWPERGGHLGEHGSLSVRQSRAPLLLSGPGVVERGVLPRAARTVDVAPTLLALAGVTPPAGLDGVALVPVAARPPAAVVGLLWDGANSTALLEGAARGWLPHVARLLARGCALQGGAVAAFPSVTLVNHTSALTGVGPGRHGIVHNAFYDRAIGQSVLANDAATWHTACSLLRPGVRTVWEMAHGMRGACINEPVDRGAAYSTFDFVRAAPNGDGARGLGDQLPPAQGDPHASDEFVAADEHYAWSTRVDALGLAQVRDVWTAPERPQLMWWNTTLTDTGHHAGGAHSAIATAALVDSDRRLGAFLDLLADLGLEEQTAVLLTADHGSVAADPVCRGDFTAALEREGIAVRDEAYGFIYLGV